MSEETFKEQVENKIVKLGFYAKNFSKEELLRVDEYCKLHFGNDRKQMILTLITMAENNSLFHIVDSKIDFIAETLMNEINSIKEKVYKDEQPKEIKKPKWEGFSREEKK